MKDQLQKLFQHVLNKGVRKEDRTGVGTISTFGYQCRFDLTEGFPIVTTKKTAFKAAVTELIWMIGGWMELPEYAGVQRTNIKFLIDNNVKIWTEWPYKAYIQAMTVQKINGVKLSQYQGMLEDICGVYGTDYRPLTQKEFEQRIRENVEFAIEYGDLGPVYQKQWRDFEGKREAVDQLQEMIRTLMSNPDSRRILSSYWNPTELKEMLLPPCFTSTALVKTTAGYKKISEVKTGEEVISDKGLIRKVRQQWITPYSGRMLEIRPWYSLPFDCTPNHPFLNKEFKYVEAGALSVDDYLAVKVNEMSIVPDFQFTQGKNQYSKETVKIDMTVPEYWYLLGYFLGDGWIIEKTGKIQLSVAVKDMGKVLPIINKVGSWSVINNSGENVKKVETRNNKLRFLLEQVGKYAKTKFIPQFVEDAPVEFVEWFLRGYQDADGHVAPDGKIVFSTISHSIALGIQSLFAKKGQACSIIVGNRLEKERKLLGRLVKTNKCYNVSPSVDNRFAYVENGYLFVKIKTVKQYSVEEIEVFNLDVADDHTYTVNNICNHNCHLLHQVWTRPLNTYEMARIAEDYAKSDSSATGMDWTNIISHYGLPTRAISLQMYQRSSDCFLGVPFDWVFYALLTHILAQITNMVADEFIWVSGDTHLYLNSLDAAKEVISREPYAYPTLRIKRKVERIEDFKVEDFELVDYKFHPAIKVEVAV